jgi:hypothetical protein
MRPAAAGTSAVTDTAAVVCSRGLADALRKSSRYGVHALNIVALQAASATVVHYSALLGPLLAKAMPVRTAGEPALKLT